MDLRGFLHKLSKYAPLEKSKTSLDLSEISAFSKKLKMSGSLLTIPRESSLFPRLPEVIKKNEEFDPFPGEIVTITGKIDSFVNKFTKNNHYSFYRNFMPSRSYEITPTAQANSFHWK